MAEEVEIVGKLSIDASDSKKRIEEINQAIAEAKKQMSEATYGTKEYEEAQSKLNKATGDLTKAQKAIGEETKETKKSFGSFFKEVATGVGIFKLIDFALGVFKETLGKNQVVVDFMSTAMNSLSIAFNDLFSYIGDHIGDITKWFADIFEHPKEALVNFGEAIKKNLIERFESFIKTLGLVGDTIKNLVTLNFDEAAKSAKAAAKESVDVLTGINNSADGIADAAKAVVDYTKKTVSAASAQTKLANQSKLAAADLRNLKEQYDREAEQQRQIRDDQSKSIEERQAANIKLGEILKDQAKVMTALADVNIKSARQELSQNKNNIELQIKLKDALTERKGILAQITGFESEQRVNEIGLAKEKLDRDKAVRESENKILLDRKKAAAELIQDELIKAQKLRGIQDEETKLELARLQDNINNAKAGTQAKVDAEIAYNEKKKDIDIANAQSEQAIDTIKKQRAKDLLTNQTQNNLDYIALKKTLAENEVTDEITRSNKLISIAQLEHDFKMAQIVAARDAEIAAAEQAGLNTAAIKDKYNTQILSNDQALAQSQKQLSDIIMQTKLDEYSAVGNAANVLGDIVGKQTAVGKGLGIATALINTYTGITEVLKQRSTLPSPFDVIAKIANVAAIAKTGFEAVKNITAVQVPNTSSGGSSGSFPTVSAPLAPQRSTTSLDAASIQGVGNAAKEGAGRAFVLNTDIKDSQEREALLVRQARLG